MRFTYDSEADAVYLYLVDEIGFGQVKRSRSVPLRMKGASVTVSFDENEGPLGIEFLGASKQFGSELLKAIAETSGPTEPTGTHSEVDESDV